MVSTKFLPRKLVSIRRYLNRCYHRCIGYIILLVALFTYTKIYSTKEKDKHFQDITFVSMRKHEAQYHYIGYIILIVFYFDCIFINVFISLYRIC